MIAIECTFCKRVFKTYPSRLKKKRAEGHFCRQRCQFDWRHVNLRGENAPNYIDGRSSMRRPRFKNTAENVSRFFKRSDPDSCWEWFGYRHRQGYGRFGLNGKFVLAHRHVYEQAFGKIPKGMSVCHSCDNPPCVNPNHLFLGTHQENMHDAATKRRFVHGAKSPLAKLTDEKVRLIRSLYMAGGISQRKIAKMFGVSSSGIARIISRKLWSHVSD